MDKRVITSKDRRRKHGEALKQELVERSLSLLVMTRLSMMCTYGYVHTSTRVHALGSRSRRNRFE